MSSKHEEKLNYICINCGENVSDLYTKYSSSVLKLNNCIKCNNIADKYIEFEPIIIIIDLVLVSRPVYRHILFNTNFNIHWKISVVLTLFESYILWINKSINSHVDNFTSEKRFYFCFAITLIENLLLWIILRILTYVCTNNRMCKSNNAEKQFLFYLLKTVTLANVTKFFLLPIIIWKNNATEDEITLHTLLITLYFILSLTHIYSVLVNCSRIKAMFITVLALSIKTICSAELNNQLQQYFLVE